MGVSFDFTGQVAFVTGAGKGIGEAVATAFAAAGGSVACFDSDKEALTQVVDGIGERGGRAIAAPGDVRDAESVKAAVDACLAELGTPVVLANVAGVLRHGALPEISDADWDLVLDVNLKGMFQTCRRLIPAMIDAGGGTIVNVSSAQAYWSETFAVPYSASKGGVVSFTRALALDHARQGIRTVGIAPGSVRTPMLLGAAREAEPGDPEKALARWADAHPVGKLTEPGQIADLALFFAAGAAPTVTGITIPVDGGMLAGPAAW